MVEYNSTPAPSPFGSTAADGVDLAFTTFLGLSVVSFSIQADWNSRGGILDLVLVEDENLDQKLQDASNNFPVIGSPQKFVVEDTDSNTIFSFAGILDSISSNMAPDGGKTYSVKIASPLRLLENSVCIFANYAGYGHEYEGVPVQSGYTVGNWAESGYGLSANGYYKYLDATPSGWHQPYYNLTTDAFLSDGLNLDADGNYNEIDLALNQMPTTAQAFGITFGTNNRNINWENLYNVLNVYATFESTSHGFSNYATYGGARNQGNGMRLDMIVVALDDLINHTASSDNQRFHGGNILSGTSTYNICGVRDQTVNSNPYYYGFDILGFYDTVKDIVGADYLYESANSSLLDLIAQVCDDAGLEFIIDLDTTAALSSTIDQTYGGTVFGGILSVRTFNRADVRCDRPFSEIAEFVFDVQVPDFGDYGSYDNIHPGLNNVASGTFREPMQHDYDSVGQSNSYPYGGKFPVPGSADSRGASITTISQRLKNATVSVRDNKDVTTRFVTGGRQSRMVKVPKHHIYQYWGDIQVTDYQPRVELNCAEYRDTADRSIPVITPYLDGDDIYPSILVDVKSILPYPESETGWDASIAYKGVYRTSPAELRAAMTSREAWEIFIKTYRPCMWMSILEKAGVTAEARTAYLNQSPYDLSSSGTEYSATVNKDKPAARDKIQGKGHVDESMPIGDVQSLKTIVNGDFATGASNNDLIDQLYNRIREIGDTHYGKSWAAWTPYVETTITDSGENIVSNYTKSWVPTNDAYLEPASFSTYHAPKTNKFVENGRTQAYSNWHYNFGHSGHYSIYQGIGQFLLDEDKVYDFTEVPKEDMHITDYCVNWNWATNEAEFIITHTRHNQDSQYTYVPFDYFYYYAPRYDHRHVKLDENGDYRIYRNTYGDIGYPVLKNDERVNIYDGTSKSATNPSTAQNILIKSMPAYEGDPDITIVDLTNAANFEKVICPEQSAAISMIDDFLDLKVPDHGVNCHHFVKFTTPRVFYPRPDGDDGLRQLGAAYVDDVFAQIVMSGEVELPKNQDILELPFDRGLLARKCTHPIEVGIPQESNRYVYGPWVTNSNFIYAGKVEYIQDDSLVPENYLLPIYGTIATSGFSLTENISGMGGLNLAGQATANAIDGYRPFAAEEGSVTIPGPPLITQIGNRLIIDTYVGPFVTDMVCRVGANGIETTYNFSSVRNKVGKPNKDFIQRLRRISNVVSTRRMK